MDNIKKIASAIYNDIYAGTSMMISNQAMSIEQLEDEVVETRAQLIREMANKNVLPKKELSFSLNCVELDCKSLDKCACSDDYSEPELHFEIPLIFPDIDSIQFVGVTDKSLNFTVFTNPSVLKYWKRRKHKRKRPYVFIDPTVNKNGMLDGWVFDAPLLERLSIWAIFYDPRQLEEYLSNTCCEQIENVESVPASLATEIKARLTKAKLAYYRQLYQQPLPNNQIPQ